MYISIHPSRYKSKTKTAYASDEYGVWVSFDDPKSLTYKLYYLLQKYSLFGVSVWALDFDDFTGTFCNAGKYPFLKQISWTMEASEFFYSSPPFTKIHDFKIPIFSPSNFCSQYI